MDLTPEKLATLRALHKAGGSVGETKDLMGMARSTIRRRLDRLESDGLIKTLGKGNEAKRELTAAGLDALDGKTNIVFPTFPDEHLDAEAILDYHEKLSQKKIEYHKKIKWFTIRVKSNDPIGINFFGDPHLGSNGCDVAALRKDIKILCETPGMYAGNCGDTVDNWGGRLVALYAHNDVSRESERVLARWFLQEAGIPWIVWAEGNHDLMDRSFTTYMRAINANIIPMVEWRAQFKLVFPNKREVKIDLSHDHKGHSMWNDLHAQEKAAMTEEFADLFIAGHRHLAGYKKRELPDGSLTTLARARGYKHADDFSIRHQFGDKVHGASMVAVIDPEAQEADDLIQMRMSSRGGAELLTMMRNR